MRLLCCGLRRLLFDARHFEATAVQKRVFADYYPSKIRRKQARFNKRKLAETRVNRSFWLAEKQALKKQAETSGFRVFPLVFPRLFTACFPQVLYVRVLILQQF